MVLPHVRRSGACSAKRREAASPTRSDMGPATMIVVDLSSRRDPQHEEGGKPGLTARRQESIPGPPHLVR